MTAYDATALQHAAEIALDRAKHHGASSAEVGVSHSNGLSVSVRQQEIETLEHNNDTGLALTVYLGQSKASASTSDLRPQAIDEAVAMACSIARHTQADEFAGLAEAALMATEFPDLSLYHPWELSAEQAIDMALACEQAGQAYDARINNSEGASVSSHQGQRVYANSHGFVGTTQSTRHSLSCTLIASDQRGMQRDYWYDIARDRHDLPEVSLVGRTAAERTLKRLDARSIKTGPYPVIFAAEVASSLFGQLVGAIRGSALYRQSSFLLDKLGQRIFPEFIHIHEQPHLLKALGSSAFDAEGVATKNRDIILDGVLQGYVLDSYSARRLNMSTTANAGGVHNLTIDSNDLDFKALLKAMDRGVIVTETMGMGVNLVNGDYSQGAAGFWVENGEIQYAIDEFTIAGQMQEMFMGIEAIANDVDLRGNIRCGSVWINKMTVAA